MIGNIQETVTFEGDAGNIRAYLTRPPGDGPFPAVILIHEIFGLTAHIKDVADRFADQGYAVLAPDLFSRPAMAEDMTPENIDLALKFQMSLPREKSGDPDYINETMMQQPADKRKILEKVLPLYRNMPTASFTQDLVRSVDFLSAQDFVNPGKIGSLGFCFGGGMSFTLACHVKLAACVVFYGSNPNPIEKIQAITCPVLGLYGVDDLRINNDLDKMVKAMVDYKKEFEIKVYPGAAHAFFNDTRPAVYRQAPARDAWERVLRFYLQYL